MNPSVFVVGEALSDIVVQSSGQPTEHPGGSPMNVAVGLARLGIVTELHTSIGNDDRGAAIASHLADSGVVLSPKATNTATTSTATARIGATGAAEYDFDVRWHPATGVRAGDGVVAVHTGSIAAVTEPGASEVRAIVEDARASCTISYDPNVRPQLMGSPEAARTAIEATMRLADVVKSSDEDLEWLYEGRDPLDSATAWASAGPALVVVTKGGAGAWASAGGTVVEVPAPAVTVADTIGAGDSFMAGLLAALADRALLGADARDALRGLDAATLRAVVEFAVACAAITVARPGANPPTRQELAA